MSHDENHGPVPADGAAPPGAAAGTPPVRQLRLVVTTDDYDAALAFYRDALGLAELGAFADPDGRVTILDAGRATLEITDEPHAAFIDRVEGVAAPTVAAVPAGSSEPADVRAHTRRRSGQRPWLATAAMAAAAASGSRYRPPGTVGFRSSSSS